MGVELEYELKLGLVDPRDLAVLLEWLPAPTVTLMQRNHYFDTSDGLLSKARIMVRVREEGPVNSPEVKVIAAAKRRKNKKKARFVAEEIECEIPGEIWAQVLAGATNLASLNNEVLAWVREQLPQILGELQSLGVVENVRACVPYEGFVLEVDKTTFPDGTVDCEVEVETQDIDGARVVVEAAAKAAGVALFDQTKGKHRRFRERLKW